MPDIVARLLPARHRQLVVGHRSVQQLLVPEYVGMRPRPSAYRNSQRTGHAAQGTGLAAKPVVDILPTVADADAEADFVPALQAAGYELRVREPRHRMFRTPDLSVHVHVYADDDVECDRYLRFRERLRSSPEDRAAYERLKRELAVRDWTDRNDYADAKGPLVEAIIARG